MLTHDSLGSRAKLALLMQTIWPNLPSDALNTTFCHDVSYWYRPKGQLTSTDDVLLAYYTLYDMKDNRRKVDDAIPLYYMDLGCGIGSSILLVTSNCPSILSAVGVEAQTISCSLLKQTLIDNKLCERLRVVNCDLREIISLQSSNPDLFKSGLYDWMTANPPFLNPVRGTLPKDGQRKFARFEMRGDILDYFKASSILLKKRTGRLLVAFPSHENKRVVDAALFTGLRCVRRLDVIGSDNSIYEIKHDDNDRNESCEIMTLDISRDQTTRKINKNYIAIQNSLGMKSRPLR